MNEVSNEAKECRAAYRSVIDEMLEAHPWSFANARIALAELANDRIYEWGYAYALPPGAAPESISLVSGVGGAGLGVYMGNSWPLSYAAGGFLSDAGYHFTVIGATLYTNIAGALLDYRDMTVTEARFTPLFARAVALELASRIVMPLTKDAQRHRTLVAMAETAKARAMAADYNRNPQTYGNHMPATLAARG